VPIAKENVLIIAQRKVCFYAFCVAFEWALGGSMEEGAD
jgi:hypothetical protein